jgi:hypothetical protein
LCVCVRECVSFARFACPSAPQGRPLSGVGQFPAGIAATSIPRMREHCFQQADQCAPKRVSL